MCHFVLACAGVGTFLKVEDTMSVIDGSKPELDDLYQGGSNFNILFVGLFIGGVNEVGCGVTMDGCLDLLV